MLNVKFTCCVCGIKFSKQQGDVDERMCDECLNHEDEFGEAAKAEDKEYKIFYYQKGNKNMIITSEPHQYLYVDDMIIGTKWYVFNW